MQLHGTDCVVDSGALISDLQLFLTKQGRQLDSHGACFTSRECQTVGGVLATNVHHSGVPTFGGRCKWIELITIKDGAACKVRCHQGSQLFRESIGAIGRSGIIVKASFETSARTYYKTDFASAARTFRIKKSMEKELLIFADKYKGVRDLHLISVHVLHPFFSMNETNAHVTDQRSDVRDLDNKTFGEEGVAWNYFIRPLNHVAYELPYVLFQVWYFVVMSISFLFLSDVPTAPDCQICLDYACSMDIATWMRHSSWEAFVPVDMCSEFGEWFDEMMKSCWYVRMSWINLRHVKGDGLVHAANPESGKRYICVGITSYHPPTFKHFEGELRTLTVRMREKFGDRVRLHPGKFDVLQDTHNKSIFSPSPECKRALRYSRSFPPLLAGVVLIGCLVASVITAGKIL